MLKEFRDFIMRGNVLDLAIAVIIGGAFGRIVSSLVNDIIMPPIGLVLGKVDFGSLFVNLSGTPYASPKGGTGRRGADAQLRPIHQHGHRLPDRRTGHLPGRARGQPPAAPEAAGCSDHEGVSVLRHNDRIEGDPLPELHLGVEARLIAGRLTLASRRTCTGRTGG